MTATALAAALLLAQAPPPAPPSPPRALHVSGEGRASAAPDVARLALGVDAQDKSLARATADATARMKKVLATLEKAGVAAKDVRTVRYAVDVQRSYEKPNQGAIVGYRVANQVLVTVRDLGRLGAILDQVVSAGSNEVGALSLEKEDTAPERARALEAAMADAHAKAAVLAKAAGVTLGDPLQVSEGGRAPVPLLREGFVAARAAAADVPISAGQLEVVATVDVTYAIR